MSQQQLDAALALHRASAPVGLLLELPISYQIDQPFCQATSSELQSLGDEWEVRRATRDLWQTLPSEPGLYAFIYESTFRIKAERNEFIPRVALYVGRAGYEGSNNTLRQRYKGEYSKYLGGDPSVLWSSAPVRTREQRLRKYLSIFPLQYWFKTVEDRSKLPQLEDRLIKLLNPPLNVASKARLKFSPELPAFKEY